MSKIEPMPVPPILHVLKKDGSLEPMSQNAFDTMRQTIEDNLSELPIDTFTCDHITGYCPVQAEGKVNGKDYYFRARHDHWRMEVEGEVIAEGDHLYASWMSLPEALQLIGKSLAAWGEKIKAAKKSEAKK